MNRWLTLALLVAVAAGLLLRWPGSSQRPMHNDEAVNGIKLRHLWHTGQYRYDPNEHHGPTLYYFTAALAWTTGTPAKAEITQDRLRTLTVLFGLGLIPLVLLFRDGLGRSGAIWGAVFTAVSPAFVFYSVYFIHEMLLVFFAGLCIAAAWRYWRTRKLYWACIAGGSFGLMAATKETFVFTVAAGAGALAATHAWNRYLDASGLPVRAARLNYRHLLLGLLVAFFVGAMLFTSFFSNWGGLSDAVKTYEPWLARAGGESPHIHPWYFYAHHLLWFQSGKGPVWTEAMLAILAVIGAAAGFHRRGLADSNGTFTRFLTFYTLLLAGIYTVIPYKTTWCLLNFWHGVLLLAGVGAAWVVRRVGPDPRRSAVTVLLAAGTVHLGAQAWRSVGPFSSDYRNPYVYAQTIPHALELVKRVREVAAAGAGEDTLIKVAAPESDYWPLPWYLVRYKNVGWWSSVPEDPYAPIMILSSKFDARLDERKTHLMTGYYELRPEVFLELYVELELWKKYLASRTPTPRQETSSALP